MYDESVDIYSGVREKRPALHRLLKDSFNRKFQMPIVPALDRCSESISHKLSQVDQLHHNGPANAISNLRDEREILQDRVKVGMAMKNLAAEKLGQS
ncbi:MAG: hypothetical protein EOP04_03155 [Proteobacteria bacterium]|nr:MAG: hypothetical protein EOP04_03155 [Pseudomonadota bacterium]